MCIVLGICYTKSHLQSLLLQRLLTNSLLIARLLYVSLVLFLWGFFILDTLEHSFTNLGTIGSRPLAYSIHKVLLHTDSSYSNRIAKNLFSFFFL